MSGKGYPYRPPCNGWASALIPHLFGCENMMVKAHKAIPVRKNVTLVPNPLWDECRLSDPPAGTPLVAPPQPRLACDTNTSCNSDGTPCGPWPRPHPANVYQLSDTETVDLSACKKEGYKVVYGSKNWHGKLPLTSKSLRPQIISIPSAGCFIYSGANNEADQVRYLRQDVTASSRIVKPWEVEGDPAYDIAVSFASSDSINRLSGRRTGHYTENYAIENSGLFHNLEGFIHDYGESTPDSIVGLALQYISAMNGLPGFEATWGETVTARTDNGAEVQTLTWSNCHLSYYSGSIASANSYRIEIYITDTVCEVRETQITDWIMDGTLLSTYEAVIRLELSEPYTAAQVSLDVDDLLAVWVLSDDAVYPWRTDTRRSLGPLVTRNERATAVPGLWRSPIDGEQWVDESLPPRDDIPDGGIVGGPLPAGSDPYFDFAHITNVAAETVSYGWQYVPQSYGAYAPSVCPHATQWTNFNTPSAELQGNEPAVHPFIYMVGWDRLTLGFQNLDGMSATCQSPISNGMAGLWKAKYAEVVIPNKSHNFFRPCGGDVTDYPTAHKICGRIAVLSATQNGGSVDLVLSSAADQLATDDYIDTTGLPGLGNNLSVTVTDSTHISVTGTLSEPYVSGGFVFSHGAPAYYWDDTGQKMDFVIREWYHDMRVFMESYSAHGRYRGQQITNETNAPEDIDCPLPADADPVNYLRTSETFLGDPETIGTGSYWLSQQITTEACIKRSVCSPAVVVFSPNNEGFANAYVGPFPTIPLDEQYGTLWLARLDQWMLYPLLVASTGTRADYVESRVTLPSYTIPDVGSVTAPELPEGAALCPCTDYIANLNADPQVTNPSICDPPYSFSLTYVPDEFPYTCRGYYLYANPNGPKLFPWTL
jgi:hypothetical protein